MFIGNTEFNGERTHFEIRFNLSIDTFIASQSNDLVHAIIISHASLSPQHRFSHFDRRVKSYALTLCEFYVFVLYYTCIDRLSFIKVFFNIYF